MTTPLDEGALEIAQVRKGQVLFKQGEPGNAAFVVNAGAIGIYREVDGQKLPLATIRKGELFGEMAVIDGSPRMATAFAIADCTITIISAANITEKMRKSDSFIKSLVQMLLNNLRTVHNSYAPKPRSLHDAVTSLVKQRDMVAGYLKVSEASAFSTGLDTRLRDFNKALGELQSFIAANRDKDRRDNAVPDAAVPR